MNSLRKTLISLAVVGIAGAVAGTGAFSAFSKTTSNDNNTVTAGDVTLSDNDLNNAAYSLPTAKPGDSAERCVRVTFDGNLPSTVKLYRSAFSGSTGLESNVNLTILASPTGTAANCSDFGASPTTVFATAALSTFTATNFTGGIQLNDQGGSAVWNNGDAVTFKITGTLQSGAPSSAQGLTTGTHSFTWEAQNN